MCHRAMLLASDTISFFLSPPLSLSLPLRGRVLPGKSFEGKSSGRHLIGFPTRQKTTGPHQSIKSHRILFKYDSNDIIQSVIHPDTSSLMSAVRTTSTVGMRQSREVDINMTSSSNPWFIVWVIRAWSIFGQKKVDTEVNRKRWTQVVNENFVWTLLSGNVQRTVQSSSFSSHSRCPFPLSIPAVLANISHPRSYSIDSRLFHRDFYGRGRKTRINKPPPRQVLFDHLLGFIFNGGHRHRLYSPTLRTRTFHRDFQLL